MTCTNNKKIYEMARMIRSHGMIREAGNKTFENKIIKKNKDLSPNLFLHKGYNMRSNEISEVMGINQLKNLDKNTVKEQKILSIFLMLLMVTFFIKILS